MKKLFYIMVPMLLLTACSEATTNNLKSTTTLATVSASSSPPSPTPASNTIQVTGPFTLSRNELFQFTKQHEYLSVVLINGKYFEDWSPGPLMGHNWQGEFQIQFCNENGEVKSAVDLNKYFNDEVVFNSFFEIDFDDYNVDGNIDFTIGQYASSNGSIFKLFTIDKSGRIEELPIRGHHEIFVSGTGRYSTKLIKNKLGFSSTYYDNSIEKDINQSFVWNGKEFFSGK